MNIKICLLICSILMLVQHCVVLGKERNYQVEFMHEKIFCSGAILNEKFILSAAHCFKGRQFKDPVSVSFGIENQRWLNVNNKQQIDLNKIIYHDKYNPATSENDISIVQLDKPITFDAHTTPIKLPDSTTKVNDDDKAIFTGFKKVEDAKFHEFSLMELNVKVLNQKECKAIMGRYNVPIFDSMICAKTNPESAKINKPCKGTSGGGPLVSRDVLIGILAFGVRNRDCGDKATPGVYTRVTSYLDWIKAHVKM